MENKARPDLALFFCSKKDALFFRIMKLKNIFYYILSYNEIF